MPDRQTIAPYELPRIAYAPGADRLVCMHHHEKVSFGLRTASALKLVSTVVPTISVV
jgi:hypothetical protein